MFVFPEVIYAHEDPSQNHYVCPVTNIGDHAKVGWVHCPLLDEQVISLASCVELQNAANDDAFDSHPDRDMFVRVGELTAVDVDTLRRNCLLHQRSLIEWRITTIDDPQLTGQLHALRIQIEKCIIEPGG